jgi:ACS family hexuronate transporter-like MFS transporter
MSTLGWPAAFLITGITGFLWLAIWWPIYRTPANTTTVIPPPRIPVKELIRDRFVVAFTLSKIFLDPVWYFYIFWFPEYLKRARHFDMAAIGTYAWIPFAVAGLGNFAGGMLSGFLLNRGLSVTVARKLSVSIFAVLMAAAIPAVLVDQASVSIALVSTAMFGYTGALANMLAMPADVVPVTSTASVYGLASMGSGFGGMIFTLITGSVIDHYSYTPASSASAFCPLSAQQSCGPWQGHYNKKGTYDNWKYNL